MDMMRMETPDLTAANIEEIAAPFPNCITETAVSKGCPHPILRLCGYLTRFIKLT